MPVRCLGCSLPQVCSCALAQTLSANEHNSVTGTSGARIVGEHKSGSKTEGDTILELGVVEFLSTPNIQEAETGRL